MRTDQLRDCAVPKSPERPLSLINWAVLAVMLSGRLGTSLVLKLNPGLDTPWDMRIMAVTFILLSGFLLLNFPDLERFHLSKLSVLMIVVFKLMATLTIILSNPGRPLAHVFEPLELLAFAAIVGLLLGLRGWLFRKPLATTREWRWLVAISAYPQALQIRGFVLRSARPSWTTLLFALFTIPFQIGHAGVFEEPVFRGLLWGKLRGLRWSNWVILLFQSALFMLSHIHYLPHQAYAFWITAPLGGLVLGALAWGSGSLAAPMLAHGIINAMMSIAAFAAYAWFR
jgi:membrane protease YdiL (CAAX protease family)